MSTWLRISLGSRREQGHRAGYGVIYSGLALGWLVMTSSACLTIEGDGGTTCSDGDPACSGGEVTTFDVTERAFGEAAEGIEREDRPFFQEGRRLFRARWGRIGQAPPDLDGLGPVFNDDSCEGCHARDGRSAPYDEQGQATSALIVKLYQPANGDQGDPAYGGQFQPRALREQTAEGGVDVAWEITTHASIDATMGEPLVELTSLGYGPLAEETRLTLRAAPPVFGLGLLEAIPAKDILAAADPEDLDGDGISGRAQMVFSPKLGEDALGRFGWRSEQATIEDQIAAAAFNDMGLTSRLFHGNSCPPAAEDCRDEHEPAFPGFGFDGPVDPGPHELDDIQLEQMGFYLRHLAVPARRNADDERVLAGEKHFSAFGCASCHTPRWETGFDTDSRVVSGQVIRPYTDMLLHDMGSDLADPGTNNAEWRTPPLWGLGLSQTVNGHVMLLHDGRARNFEDAILWHGGEASRSRDRYVTATQREREELWSFLWSL